MEPYEDDDDTHFCIKCHLTVNGLENYVRHRQSGCRPPESKPETSHEPPTTPTTVTYPEILNADAFFSSLELQSSSKSNPTPRVRSLAAEQRDRKIGNKSEDRRRRSRRGQDGVSEDSGASAKEKLLNMPPVVTDLDDLMDHLGIPSLVGFPEIVAATGNKSSAGASAIGNKSVAPSASSKVIGDDHQSLRDSPLEALMTSSKVTGNSVTGGGADRKRITDSQRIEHQDHVSQQPIEQDHADSQPTIEQDHAEWLDDEMLADLDANSEPNKEPEAGDLAESYAEYEYQDDEESADDESLAEAIGAEDSYTDDEDADDRDYQRHGHTGGKWKPSELLQDIGRLNDDELDQDDEHQEQHQAPHTGGKWKPADSSQLQRLETEDEVAGAAAAPTPSATSRQQPRPPPGHTRGKWIPGAAGDLGSGYWCDPCGRKLASRLLYNRHLLSDLHARRSIQEIDGDLQLPRGAAPHLPRKSASKRQRALVEIRSRSKSQKPEDEKDAATRKKTRRREKEVLWCEMCHARVRRPQMGKHLLSHYHCRVAGANPAGASPAARRFILENMGNVVRQCPFQCASCRFYCNTEETFLLHWRSKFHAERFDDTGGNYKCTACDFWCVKNATMENHLQGAGHREVVAMMNGSVPVVVRRQRSLVCETCSRRFRYNVQLRFHARETGHRGGATSGDEYQSKIVCGICPQVVRSLVALQRHQLCCHPRDDVVEDNDDHQDDDDDADRVIVQPTAPYFCSFCTLNFTTAREAVLHRRTPSHKEIVKAQKLSTELENSLSRECPHCNVKQSSLVEHKQHLLEKHPELCHRCPKCGKLFALPQDVTRHTRGADCAKSTPSEDADHREEPRTSEDDWRCGECPFVTDSQAEFVFHDALHAGSVATSEDVAGGSSSSASRKYRCPLCDKSFAKGSLRNHIRSHTGERPFRCPKCSASFARRSGLNAHRKECAISSGSVAPWPGGTADGSRQRNHSCSECNTAFYTNVMRSRLVTYQEWYTKRRWGMFKKRVSRVNYQWQTYVDWKEIFFCCPGYETYGHIGAIPSCHPICTSRCMFGTCQSPNKCSCVPPYREAMIAGTSRCVPTCKAYGPNECGPFGKCESPDVCSCRNGFELSKLTDRSLRGWPCVPQCLRPRCGTNSFCRAPNICACADGHAQVYKLLGVFNCEPICDPPCVNGTCTKPGYCECHVGYDKDPSGSSHSCRPVCDPPCLRGTCTSPNHCDCHEGHAKVIPAVLNACHPVCHPPCVNGICTKPGYCECHVGYEKDPTTSSQSCRPACEPACVNGTCTKPGYCECHVGHEKDPSTSSQSCQPVCRPGCRRNSHCVAPNECRCDFGYAIVAPSTVADPTETTESSGTTYDFTETIDFSGTTDDFAETVDFSDTTDDFAETTDFSDTTDDFAETVDFSDTTDDFAETTDFSDTTDDFAETTDFSDTTDDFTESSDLSGTTDDFTETIDFSATTDDFTETTSASTSPFDYDETICQPVCKEVTCMEHESCVAPEYCECDSGYERPLISDETWNQPNSRGCLPRCEPACVNADCESPNRCTCRSGYSPNPMNDSVCDPICVDGCHNATCTSPGHCECLEGHEKAPRANGEGQEVQENSCRPSCPGGCDNGSCVAPGQCHCDSGYVLETVLVEVTDGTTMETSDGSTLFSVGTDETTVSDVGYNDSTDYNTNLYTSSNTDSYTSSNTDSYTSSNTDSYTSSDTNSYTSSYTNSYTSSNTNSYTSYDTNSYTSYDTSSNTNSYTSYDTSSNTNSYTSSNPNSNKSSTTTDESGVSTVTGGRFVQFCRPFCEPACPIGSQCVAPKQCESLDHKKGSNNPSPRVSSIDECGDNVHFLLDGMCICKFGWAGWRCEKPRLCGLVIKFGNGDAGSTTQRRHALRQHMLRHAGKNYKCGLPGCPTVLRTANELRSHRLLVHETGSSERQFRCDDCSYAAKTRTQLRRHHRKHEAPTEDENPRQLTCPYANCNFVTKISSHLTRHIRLHTGTKPYKCRHCKYASNNLENLRKHVLSTSLHPGKTIYECDTCRASGSNDDPYSTNFAKELRAHLLEAHPREFPRPSHASDHVAGIFGPEREQSSPTPDVDDPCDEESITVRRTDHAIKSDAKPRFTT